MATTKILPVRKRLKDCLDYAANPKKTEIFRGDALDRLMHYTQNEDKTEHQLYVTGFNCDPQNACLIMEATKRRWHKDIGHGNVGYHIIQSFKPGEASPDQVHQIGCELARRCLADRFECTVSTHLDKGHLHNHIVVNSVSFMDGKMFRNDFKTYYQGIRKVSDDLCRQNQLSVIETDGRGISYGEWRNRREGKPTLRGMVKADVEMALAESSDFDDFVGKLHQMALAVSVEVCGRLGISPPADAADRLNGLRAHIPAGEERRALEEVREMAKVFGDTVCKELDLQRPRSDLQRAEER